MGLIMDYVYTVDFPIEYTIREIAPNAGGIIYWVLSKVGNNDWKYEHDEPILKYKDAMKFLKKLEIKRFKKQLNTETDRYNFKKYFKNKYKV